MTLSIQHRILALSTYQPMRGDRVANALPAFLHVAAQEQVVFRGYRVNEVGKVPEVLTPMIIADREDWVMLLEQVGRSDERFRFHSFDVHFDVRGRDRPRNVIQSSTLHRCRTILTDSRTHGSCRRK